MNWSWRGFKIAVAGRPSGKLSKNCLLLDLSES
jgi:hypothetical protein